MAVDVFGVKKEVVPLTEAATRLGRNRTDLAARMRYCALHGLICPVGFALPPATEDGQWIYVIPRERFERYMAGEDFIQAASRGREDAG